MADLEENRDAGRDFLETVMRSLLETHCPRLENWSHYVVDRFPIHLGVAGHEGTEWNRSEVVGAYCTQRSAVATDRRADAVADEASAMVSPRARTAERSASPPRRRGAAGLR